jgi:hypothetical protein
MSTAGVKKKAGRPLVTVKVVYSKNGGSGLKDAYRLLARKVLEAKEKCTQQSMSE